MPSNKDAHRKPASAAPPPALNEAQMAAKEAPRGPFLIVAGAGTGKTRTLIARLAHFIATGTPQERICAITFTNKAANEMRNRISTIDNKQLTIDQKRNDVSHVNGHMSNVRTPF